MCIVYFNRRLFYVFIILQLIYTKSNSVLRESINEEPGSVIESIDDISKEELDSIKEKIYKSSISDHETYIKQFWVGVLEGDGTIIVSCPGANHVKVRMFFSPPPRSKKILPRGGE